MQAISKRWIYVDNKTKKIVSAEALSRWEKADGSIVPPLDYIPFMEKNGLIVRESVDYDARLKRIVLTEKANDLFCLFKEEIRKNEELLKKGFSQEELETLIYLLGKVQLNLLEDAKKECERTKCKKLEC